MVGREFERTRMHLDRADLPELTTEWSLFTHQLQFGFDLVRAAIDFEAGKPLAPGESRSAPDVSANRGWQPSGVRVEEGQSYEITATGEVVLAKRPKPWTSQPQGISILYSEGHPIGLLLAAVRREPHAEKTRSGEPNGSRPFSRDSDETMLKEILVGRRARFVAAASGTLYLRINDHWGSLADNEGHYQVVVRAVADKSP